MKILLTNHTPLLGSGSGTYTEMLASSLFEMGHDVAVLTPAKDSDPTLDSRIARFSLGKFDTTFPSFTGHPLSRVTYNQLNVEQIDSLYHLWQDSLSDIHYLWRPDIVHVQHFWIIAKSAISLGIKPIITCHGSEIDFSLRYKPIADLCMPNPSLVGAIIYISDHIAQKSNLITGLVPRQFTLLNPYNNKNFFYQTRSQRSDPFPHIGFVGRLVSYKNCELFLRSLLELQTSFPQLIASVVGDGPERAHLESLVFTMGLDKIVNFYGYISQQHVAQLYRRFDVLVVPSIQEPFGLVAIEAAACGTPVVVSSDGGLRELIYHPYIYGFESNNLLNLITVVKDVLIRSYTEESQEQASNFVNERYSLLAYSRKLIDVYTGVFS